MYLYMIGAHSVSGAMRHFKVGITSDMKRRIKELQTGNNLSLRLILAWECQSREVAIREEARLHNDCRGLRGNGEWYYEHAFRKVLEHILRQLDTPAISGTKDNPFGVPYLGTRTVNKALEKVCGKKPKKPKKSRKPKEPRSPHLSKEWAEWKAQQSVRGFWRPDS